MAKALATESGLNFLAVKGPELFNKYVGESEKAIRNIFAKARHAAPSVIFFDEIDAIAVKRQGSTSVSDRVLSQLLLEMDGIEDLGSVTIVAATNRPDILDDALLRPGRLDAILYVSPPDFEARRSIFAIQQQKMTWSKDSSLDTLAQLSQGFSGAECVAACQTAAFKAIEQNMDAKEIDFKYLLEAVNTTTKRITPEMVQFYEDFRLKCGLMQV